MVEPKGLSPKGICRPVLRGHVAGDSQHATHPADGVAVDRGVEEDFGEHLVLVAVAQGQRVVSHRPLVEHSLVDLFGLLGLGEVDREVSPEELVRGDSGGLDRGFVDVGDLAVGADRHHRVQACLDQASGVLGCLLQLGHVAEGPGCADDFAAGVADR